jgi:hypothetical protein
VGTTTERVPQDDGTIGKPEAILRYTSGGTSVYEAVRLYGVSTIPQEHHLTQPEQDPIYDAAPHLQHARSILRASEYGHE